MGFFSKKRAEDGKSIPVMASGLPQKVHYMLQPNGEPSIPCGAYEGYGNWSGIDWHVWMTEMNGPALGLKTNEMSFEQRRMAGIAMNVGDVFKDTDTGQIWWIGKDHGLAKPEHNVFPGNYGAAITGYNDQTPNDLVSSGKWQSVPVKEVLEIPYPIKISAHKDAVYEDLPASGDCEYQGYWYPNDAKEFREATGLDIEAVYPDYDPHLDGMMDQDDVAMNSIFDDEEDDYPSPV
jgi:hypothetical protein